MKEYVINFGDSGQLVGILTKASEKMAFANSPAVIVLNSGLVHHIGPNRLSVRLARNCASMGFNSFRFDFSGIGDSPVSTDNISMSERYIKETQAAMDLLSVRENSERFILVGNCSGAAFSFLAARTDERVVGSVLINLPGLRKLLRYYVKLALQNPKIWLRLFRGSLQIHDFYKNFSVSYRKADNRHKTPSYDRHKFVDDLEMLINRGMKLLLVYSEWDPGLPYFRKYIENRIESYRSNGQLQKEIIPGINHDFNLLGGQEALIRIICQWASQTYSTQGN